MKREQILNIITIAICFALWFMPLQLFDYRFAIEDFLGQLFSGALFTAFAYIYNDTWIIIVGCITIVTLILSIVKSNITTKIFATISSTAYVVLWIVAIFVPFPTRILDELGKDGYGYWIWLLLYFTMFLAIIVLTFLQWLPFISRRPTKAARLQAQVDDLQKQIDELKKGE